MAKLFSVIIPCYKNSKLLHTCIDSVLNQTYPAIEIIICEDCGGNFDAEYYQKYIEENNVGNIISQLVYSNPENYGTVKNLNCAIKRSKGEYIKIIAADDALASNESLEIVTKEMDLIKEDCMLCDVQLCDGELNPVEIATSDFLNDIDKLDAQWHFCCITSVLFVLTYFF